MSSIGNAEGKELICMTHGHELKRGECGRRGRGGVLYRKEESEGGEMGQL